jgi:hypothetical protein
MLEDGQYSSLTDRDSGSTVLITLISDVLQDFDYNKDCKLGRNVGTAGYEQRF